MCYTPPPMTKAKAKTKTKTRASPRLPAEYVGLSVEEQIALLHEQSIRTEKNIDRLVQKVERWECARKNNRTDSDEITSSEVREVLRDSAEKIGYVDRSELLEVWAFEAVWAAKEIGGIPIVDVLRAGRRKYGCRYDLICLSDTKTIVVEFRNTLHSAAVARFAHEQVPLFRRAFPEYARGKGVIGAMVYESAEGKSAEKALEAGLILVRAEGKKELRHIQSAADLASKPARAKKRKKK